MPQYQPTTLSPAAWMPAAERWASSAAGRRSLPVLGVATLHLAALWLLMQAGVVQQAVALAPRVVRLFVVASEVPRAAPPERPLPTPPAPQRPAAPPPLAPPVVSQIEPPPTSPVPVAIVAATVPPPRAGGTPEAAAATTVTATPTPAQHVPRVLPPDAVAYLVRPPIEVPLASRRLRESGTVLLRVWVGADGVPQQVGVQRSSGFARLDEQAVWAMKQARFSPHRENGVAVDCIVVQPVQYEVD